mmetsp:Transcript_17097/g.21054  ORF Transcript_17097/g.21054 Transcript_17097/m.21054 type:complete len:238 (+) Transcript_17097:165-878(+)
MDSFVEIEAENSAWDSLKESFVAAAAKGQYLDLTQGSVIEISAEEADKEFSTKPVPIDPKSIVQCEKNADNGSGPDLDLIKQAKLKPIRDGIKSVLMLLQHARKCILEALLQKLPLSVNLTNDVNWGVDILQKLINQVDYDTFYMSQDTVKSVESLNRLVAKANVLISEYNDIITTELNEHDGEYYAEEGSGKLVEEDEDDNENSNTTITPVKQETNRKQPLRRSGRVRKKLQSYNP